MTTIRSITADVLDRWAPNAATLYRKMRDRRAAVAPALSTTFGFNFAGNAAMAAGKFEADELSVFRKYLDRCSACIDIGANIGWYSCLAAAQGKQVVAVEPLADNLGILYKNLVSNEFFEVEVYPLGLGAKPGIQRLYGGGTMASFLPGWAKTPQQWQRIVPVTTLDVVINSRFDGLPLLIKMDVEGFEREVLRGAERTLALKPRPVWLVEICLNEHFPSGVNERFLQTFEVFWRHGYQARTADSEQRLVAPEAVSRWASQGAVDYGSHNYVFLEP
jgi:FkbM family methyltransferase